VTFVISVVRNPKKICASRGNYQG